VVRTIGDDRGTATDSDPLRGVNHDCNRGGSQGYVGAPCWTVCNRGSAVYGCDDICIVDGGSASSSRRDRS
jgi:hypothetical protein